MASHALRREVDELREYMKELSYQGMRTEMAVNRLSEEMREFKDETREHDAMLVCPDVVLINETKSRLQAAHIDELLDKLTELPRFYPEYRDRRIVGVLASQSPDAGVVNRATRKGVLVMGMGDEAMQVLNPDALRAPGDSRPPPLD